jgi:hypothetical protein
MQKQTTTIPKEILAHFMEVISNNNGGKLIDFVLYNNMREMNTTQTYIQMYLVSRGSWSITDYITLNQKRMGIIILQCITKPSKHNLATQLTIVIPTLSSWRSMGKFPRCKNESSALTPSIGFRATGLIVLPHNQKFQNEL